MKKMRILKVDSNEINSLELLENCVFLTSLHCRANKLTSFLGLEPCQSLTDLRCDDNDFESYEGLKNCTQLKWVNEARIDIDNLAKRIKLRGPLLQEKVMSKLKAMPKFGKKREST